MTDVEKNVEEIAAEENAEKEKSTECEMKKVTETDRKETAENEISGDGKENISSENTETNGKQLDSSEEVSKLEADIIRQMEYYFGDANLRRDKFLLEQISKDTDGWVPFSVLLTFKRLANLSTNVDEIVNSIMKSDEGLLEVSDDKTKVRRHPERPVPELNEEARKEIMTRTAYAKGFPLNSEMSELLDFFAPYEKVVNITMRKYLDKPNKTYKFKGSVFVTFSKKEQCEEFLNIEKIEYKGRELIRKWQESYIEEKREEVKMKNSKSKKGKSGKAESPKIELPKGALIQFHGVQDKNLSREKIKEKLIELGAQVAYIEFNKGDENGYIRLSVADSGKTILDKVEDGKLKLDDTEVELTLKLVEGEEEIKLLQKAVESMKSRKHTIKHHGKVSHGHKQNRKRKARGNDEREDIEGGEQHTPVKQGKGDAIGE